MAIDISNRNRIDTWSHKLIFDICYVKTTFEKNTKFVGSNRVPYNFYDNNQMH